MKATETGKEKVKRICEVLRQETLEPAIREAHDIVERAHADGRRIVEEARAKAALEEKKARDKMERDKVIFQAAVKQGCRQALETLKQSIAEKLFQSELGALLGDKLQDSSLIARLIEAIIAGIHEQGIDGNLSAFVAASIPPREINTLLAHRVVQRLREKGVLIGTCTGGVQVKMHDRGFVLDLSDHAVRELVAGYIRKDFHELLFGQEA